MFITNAFSVILAYTLFATANGAGVRDDLSVSLARLEDIKANIIAEAVNARDVNTPATVPPAVASDIADIVAASNDLAASIVALVTDLGDPFDISKRSKDTIMSDALTIYSDLNLLISDIAKLAADAGVPDNYAIPGFPF